MKITKSVELTSAEVISAIHWYLVRKGQMPRNARFTGATVHNEGDDWTGMRVEWSERDDSTEPPKTETP